jgi:hypothetical protein
MGCWGCWGWCDSDGVGGITWVISSLFLFVLLPPLLPPNLTSLLNSSSLVPGYPHTWYKTASWLLIVAVQGISQRGGGGTMERVLMEIGGLVGDQTGNMDVSGSGVGADGGVIEGGGGSEQHPT